MNAPGGVTGREQVGTDNDTPWCDCHRRGDFMAFVEHAHADKLVRIVKRTGGLWIRSARPEPICGVRENVHSAEWLRRMLDAELSAIASAPEGERNATLYRRACRVANHVRTGELDGEVTRQLLREAAEVAWAVGRPAEGHEIANTINSAFRAAGAT